MTKKFNDHSFTGLDQRLRRQLTPAEEDQREEARLAELLEEKWWEEWERKHPTPDDPDLDWLS